MTTSKSTPSARSVPGHRRSLCSIALEPVGEQLARAQDVLLHQPARLHAVACGDRVEHGLVRRDVLPHQPRVALQRRPRQVAREAQVELLDGLLQAAVARRRVDHAVEEVVGRLPALAGVGGVGLREERVRRLAEHPLRLPEPVELPVHDRLGGELGGEAFELRAHLVGLARLARRRPAHARAAVRDEGERAGSLEFAQRLPHRRAAHPELGRERVLAEPLVAHVLAREDARLDLDRQLVDERLGVARVVGVRGGDRPRHESILAAGAAV